LEYKNAFQIEKLCVHTLMTTLKELCPRYLYRFENIHINKNWDSILQSTTSNTPIENSDIEDKDQTSSDSENEMPTETLVHGYIGSQCIHDLQDKLIELSPAEG